MTLKEREASVWYPEEHLSNWMFLYHCIVSISRWRHTFYYDAKNFKRIAWRFSKSFFKCKFRIFGINSGERVTTQYYQSFEQYCMYCCEKAFFGYNTVLCWNGDKLHLTVILKIGDFVTVGINHLLFKALWYAHVFEFRRLNNLKTAIT